ncbi:unnamed protein product, partial [Polarella glacialis]
YYTVHAFNSDPSWLEGFRSMWLADWASYNSSAFQGGDTRYGNGAGTTPDWCSGKTYSADKLESNPNSTGCRMFSSYCTAGYLPNSPALIAGQLLQLLAQGDSVLPLPGLDGAPSEVILGRKSMLDPGWDESSWITMVDMASELLGLATIWLGAEFFTENTDHFSDRPGAWAPPRP